MIPRLPPYYDEPFGDSSAIPTFLVAELAQQHVTVALSGDGGDELFGGYGRYFNSKAERLWQLSQRFPKPVSRWLPMLMGRSVSPFGAIGAKVAQRMEMIADLSGCDDHPAYYERMTSQWYHLPTAFQPSGLPYGLNANLVKSIQPSLLQMMAIDSVTYLPDDILVKVDWAAMAVSLETRVPLLDHRVVELAWQLPTNFLAYQSLMPLIAALLILAVCSPWLHFTPIGGVWERRVFYRVFAAGFAALGIAGIYAEWMGDPSQLTSDASGFYDLAVASRGIPLSLEELRAVSERALAIIMWQRFYDFFAALGFEKLRYIGLLLNVIAVASSP